MSIVDRNLEDLRMAAQSYLAGSPIGERVWLLIKQVADSRQWPGDVFTSSHEKQLASIVAEVTNHEELERIKVREEARRKEEAARQLGRELQALRKMRECELASLRNKLVEITSNLQPPSARLSNRDSAKVKVKEILRQLRNLYKADKNLFDDSLLDDINAAKVCVGIATIEQLEQEARDRRRKAVISAHAGFLKARGLDNKGTRQITREHRVTHCYACKEHLDNAIDVECAACGWIICGTCGACGCGYPGIAEHEVDDY